MQEMEKMIQRKKMKTDSESGEGGIREQLPAELRGQRMYRLRLPLTQERQRVRNLQPNEGGGGGGSSPSSSPPPSDHPQNRNPRRRRRTRRVYVLQGPVGPPGRGRERWDKCTNTANTTTTAKYHSVKYHSIGAILR